MLVLEKGHYRARIARDLREFNVALCTLERVCQFVT